MIWLFFFPSVIIYIIYIYIPIYEPKKKKRKRAAPLVIMKKKLKLDNMSFFPTLVEVHIFSYVHFIIDECLR